MNIQIDAAEHLCLFGRTRSGKTTLAKYLLHRIPRWAVLDAKHTFDDGTTEIVPAFQQNLDRQIIRVPPVDNEGRLWDDAIMGVWRAGNRLLYVDEATLITPARTILPSYGRAIRTGIERGVGVWTGSQRPKDIPSVVYTETRHFFIFQLIWDEDRDKVVSFTGDTMRRVLPKLRRHECVYYDVWEDRMQRLNPVLRERRVA